MITYARLTGVWYRDRRGLFTQQVISSRDELDLCHDKATSSITIFSQHISAAASCNAGALISEALHLHWVQMSSDMIKWNQAGEDSEARRGRRGEKTKRRWWTDDGQVMVIGSEHTGRKTKQTTGSEERDKDDGWDKKWHVISCLQDSITGSRQEVALCGESLRKLTRSHTITCHMSSYCITSTIKHLIFMGWTLHQRRAVQTVWGSMLH